MANYDFHKVFGAYEFQDFARDVIQIREGVTFESFAEGRDMGIDNRYIGTDGSITILQAKRWKQSASVPKSLLRKERQKLVSLNVDRYIIVFSQDLSVQQKDEIFELFSPYIKAKSDIVGGDDLNNLIAQEKYQRVKEQYVKLWLQDADVLKHMLHTTVHSELMEASLMELRDAQDKARLFVETNIYEQAFDKLCRNKTLIISGEPGVGKTTLANYLALYFYGRNQFETIVWVSSIGDLYTVNQMPGRKIVVFDDFWGGDLFAGNGTRNEEQRLARFIELIQRQNDYYLILTTREYILEQRLKRNEDLRRIIDKYKLACQIAEYSAEDKLKIYLSHLEEGEITWEQTVALFSQGHRITDSPNYNPRVIDMFVKNISLHQSGDGCVARLLDYLNHPKDFWSGIYENLSMEARLLYIILILLPLPMDLENLKPCYHNVLRFLDKSLEWKGLSKIVAELEETVIKTISAMVFGTTIFVTFQNPSAKDFIYEYIRDNFVQYEDILYQSCIYFSQCVELLRLSAKAKATVDMKARILKKAIQLFDSDSITVPSVVLDPLEEYGRQNHKFIFRSAQPQKEFGNGRFYQLLYQYDRSFYVPYQALFKNTFEAILEDMEKESESLLEEDLIGFGHAAWIMLQEGLYDNTEKVIETYVLCLMRNRMHLNIADLCNDFRQIWHEYYQQNKAMVIAYIEKYYCAEFCLAAVENDMIEFEDLAEQYDLDLEAADLEPLEAIEECKRYYSGWLTEENEDEYISIKTKKGQKQDYDEINREFEDTCLKGIKPIAIKDIEVYIRESDLPKNLSDVMLEVSWDYEMIHWWPFMDDEDSFDFLLSFYEYSGYLAQDLVKAAEDMFAYIVHRSGLAELELMQFLMTHPIKVQDEIWIEKQLRDNQNVSFQPSVLDQLVKTGIFLCSDRWFRLCNDMLVFFAFIKAVRLLSDQERSVVYQSFFQDAVEREQKNQYLSELIHKRILWIYEFELDKELLLAFWAIDKTCFMEDIYLPAVNDLYDKIHDKDENKVIQNLIQVVQLEFDIRSDGRVMGTSCVLDDYFQIREVLQDEYLTDLIPDDLLPEQITMLMEQGLLKDDRTGTVSLMELYKKGILDAMGMQDQLLTVWHGLKAMKGDGQLDKR